MKKKRQKKTSFSTALADAEKRLAKALKEREAAQKQVADLNQEIPTLQQTVAVLQRQVGTKGGDAIAASFTDATTIAVTGEHRAVTSAATQKTMKMTRDGIEYEIPLPVEDLSGAGVIPAKSGPEIPNRELSDDELLELGDVK